MPGDVRAGRHATLSRFERLPTDPITIVLVAAQATLALALLFVLPGLTWGPLVLPGAPTPLHAIGRAVGVSLLIASAACTVLAAVGVLRPWAVVALLGTVTVAPFARARARSAARDAPRRLRCVGRWWLGALAGGAVVAVVVVARSIADAGADLLPSTSTAWYYMAVARLVAEAGSIPATIAEWGGARPFPTDYLPATTHAAAAIELLPGGLLVAVAWYRTAVLIAAAVLAALMLRRWFSTWIAVLGACLLLATVRLEAKFLDLRPETFGLVLALFTIWVTDRSMTDRSRRSAAVAVAAATGTFLAHAEVYLLLGPALGGLAAARILVGGGRLGIRVPRLAVLRPVGLAALVFVASFVVGSAINAIVAGEFRLVGYLTSARDVSQPIPVERIPPGWTFSGDPTWDFYVASVAPALDGQPPPSNFFGSALLPRSILNVWPGLDARGRGDLVTLGLLLATPLVVWPWLDHRRRRFIAAWWVFGAALLAGSWLFFTISHTYVPARIGPRRLMPYELVVPAMSAVLMLFVLDRLVRNGWRRLFPRRGAMVAAGAALALLTIAATAPAPPSSLAGPPDEPALSQVGYDALRWIDRNLPVDARILTNAYTDGSMLAVARRAAILDGRAVYLENPAFLAESTSLALGARVLFADPNGAAAGAYLADERVTYVLVATRGPNGNDVGGYLLMDTNLPALQESGRYTQVRSFGDGRVLLFEVRQAP